MSSLRTRTLPPTDRNGSLQLNVGIIAATAPTLRPLLRKSSLTTSENRYNQFDANDRLVNGTIGSGVTPRPRKIDSLWSHAGPVQVNFEMMNNPRRTPNGVATSNIYSGRDEQLGSEVEILGRDCRDAKGIRCTTKVVIGEFVDENHRRT